MPKGFDMNLTHILHGLNEILHSGYDLPDEQREALVGAIMLIHLEKSEDELKEIKRCTCEGEDGD